MQPITPTDPLARSADLIAENVAKLRALFPELVTEGERGYSVNVDVLKQLVGDQTVTDADEKYGLNWHGKRQARRLALTPSAGTLRPAKAESVDWDTTQNLMIEGDNLEVLKLLKKSYAGKVKMIYIDPPYNTGKEFIYDDDFSDALRSYLNKVGGSKEGMRTSSNGDSSGRFHTNWANMIYPRLLIAKELLESDGSVYISIDDHEYTHLRLLCNEVFGEENFVASVVWQKVYSSKNSAKHFSWDHDYIVHYAKQIDNYKVNLLPRSDAARSRYTNRDDDDRGDWKSVDLTGRNKYSKGEYTIVGPTGRNFKPSTGRYWVIAEEAFWKLDADNRIWWGEDKSAMPSQKKFISEVQQGVVPSTLWKYKEVGHTQDAKRALTEHVKFQKSGNVLNSVKPPTLIQRMLLLSTDISSNDLVVDFFGGSGSTAHGVMYQNQLDGGNRRCITVQIPEQLQHEGESFNTIFGMSMQRIRSVSEKIRSEDSKGIDTGFRVFKLDESNHAVWDPNRDDLAASVNAFTDPIKPGRSDEDVLYELLLKMGLDLCVPIEERDIAGVQVSSVANGTLFVCLAREINRDVALALGKGIPDWRKELGTIGTSTAIFRDAAFTDNNAKTNLTETLKQWGISEVRSL